MRGLVAGQMEFADWVEGVLGLLGEVLVEEGREVLGELEGERVFDGPFGAPHVDPGVSEDDCYWSAGYEAGVC